ncbi:L-glutamate gamma-semialdehyde dehydrogenase [Rhodoblastus acidophilus]|uniref:Bifunctional protein PutA n=1 Tax=Candidatus Rhodoblastus alkanivorans TaxID=2954117 RepID=A0ABS9Z4A4_9HYPH|nr:L-glutamate gamma-semialdehyde dehydrogenase [Candidatus Rhodoblastus alkanivorans]MCI4679218.1 L-glutamate gamma-semialdehyde dehydrogenase [Candidatus Rhodoblastus alkanivorans]MCI4682458.1 L-glutamate gamma-semialdehyde dehydrogenase [Candidatus Rhodoblastus alkanivorans]MDI4639764.1 L-glutamate gamma-semialdehyde dehydrogenase [Rhodoblastus acidophilus]
MTDETKAFSAPYAPPDEDFAQAWLAEPRRDDLRAAESALAAQLLRAIRARAPGVGGVEDFLHEFKLSSREGLAIMALAEALARAPDNPTADLLLADKLAAGDFDRHALRSDAPLIQACAFALGFSARLVEAEFSPSRVVSGLARRLGVPALRAAARQAMRLLGGHFVFGETIQAALARAQSPASRRDLHSFDMLGEGARTARDAQYHFDAYANAIESIGASAKGAGPAQRPGISIKLSALHPRYEAISAERVRAELTPRLLELALLARERDIGLTVDAEEADRLELSLDIFGRVLADPALGEWEGFGLAVQAYQKRAGAIIDHVAELARARRRRTTARLVKGAYWDSEIKRAQERGLADYPVFTRKAMTDLNYLACAGRLLAESHIFPQFATHNALTAAVIVVRANRRRDYEFQRLHGMGEALHEALRAHSGVACRVYAPVGPHRDLLAYLVRRLIENGANTSFVARAAEPDAAEKDLLADPLESLRESGRARHARLPLPRDLFAPERKNSAGVEFGHSDALAGLLGEIAPHRDAARAIAPHGIAPEAAFAHTQKAFPGWSATAVGRRIAILLRAADLFEANRGRLIALLQEEAGKTLDDCVAEVREAADLCRYYAAEARKICAGATLPGVTGEDNKLLRCGRGVFVCISPWNFPLAIFSGQIAAALAAGNCVIAKPAEQSPRIARVAAELFAAAGLPEGALVCAPGDGDLGAALVADPRAAGVAFTGSVETAQAIQRALTARGGPIVPFIAETGGINAMIVDSTALLEQVTDDVLVSAFRSAGQRCSALRLLCLQEDIYAPALDMLIGAAAELRVGDPRDIATHVGPVIDAGSKAALECYLAARAADGRILHAGTAPEDGFFVAPHIVRLDRPRDLTREIFGPVLHVTTWRAERFSDLIDEIAASGYGLTLGLHSRIESRIAELARKAPAGNIYVNRNMIGAVVGSQPFGGFGFSGTGPKAGGPDYLRRFYREATLSVNTASLGGDAGLLAQED